MVIHTPSYQSDKLCKKYAFSFIWLSSIKEEICNSDKDK